MNGSRNGGKSCLVGGLEHFLFFHMLGISSSQLTNSYFSEEWPNHQPVVVDSHPVVRSGSALASIFHSFHGSLMEPRNSLGVPQAPDHYLDENEFCITMSLTICKYSLVQ